MLGPTKNHYEEPMWARILLFSVLSLLIVIGLIVKFFGAENLMAASRVMEVIGV